MLSEMKNGHRYNVEDPYGGTLDQYKECVAEIEDLVEVGFNRIRSLVEKSGL
jgi:hypothetical protein